MSADEIFVLVLVVGCVLLIARLSWSTHQRAKMEEQQQAETAAGGAQLPTQDVKTPVRTSQQRKRQAR